MSSPAPSATSAGDAALQRAAGLTRGSQLDAATQQSSTQQQQQPKDKLVKEVGWNWAKCYAYTAGAVAYPSSTAEVCSLVRAALAAPSDSALRSLRALGSRHSFSSVADSHRGGTLLSVERFAPNLLIDAEARTASFSAGWRYGDLAVELHRQGWALHNLASLPHISVAGAVATSTHGSGDRNGTLATAVRSLEFVSGTGEVVTLTRGVDPEFHGAVVGLGCLGIVTRLTLDVERTFDVRQDVYDGVAWVDVMDNFDFITSSAYSVSMFTNWVGETMGLVWLKSRTGAPGPNAPLPPPNVLLGRPRETLDRHMLSTQNAAYTTAQSGVAGPWSERLAHFRLEFTPSAGEELQSEYLCPRRNILAALRGLRAIADRIEPLLLITELRTMAPDALWMSGSYCPSVAAGASPSVKEGFVGIHFTWKKLIPEVTALLPSIESILLPLGARPHWGKIFSADSEELQSLYPRWGDFQRLRQRYDPQGLFGNEWTQRKLGGEGKQERQQQLRKGGDGRGKAKL